MIAERGRMPVIGGVDDSEVESGESSDDSMACGDGQDSIY